ncbi:MAG TPA: 4-hydroxy-tetrahydrodipicolinate synthase [Acidimicrobiales bacterium]|nr:4-hydroxy-tetrahydrodipicolinate synthase [Acidimicrobiales bacterium]
MARFGTVITAMVTPFDGEGALDLHVAAQLARWLADHGSDGLVVAGTTGEGSTLTDDEKLDLWRAVAEAVAIPVIANTGSNDTAHSVHLTRQAAGLGVAGVLAVTPYYNRPSQSGIEAHFRAVAGATDLPVMLYDIPVRSGRKISHEVMVRLAHGVRNMAGVKDAAADVAATARLIAAVPDSFEVYSGNDDYTLPLLALGAVGVVGVATHWVGLEMAEMIAAASKGDLAHAREINGRLLESFVFETGDAAPNPIPAKAMMRTLGVPVGECRLPMGPAPAGLEDRAREVYAALHG